MDTKTEPGDGSDGFGQGFAEAADAGQGRWPPTWFGVVTALAVTVVVMCCCGLCALDLIDPDFAATLSPINNW